MEVVESDSPGIIYQPRSGRPGRIRIDKDASYSALLHEYTHAMDDYKGGWNAFKDVWNASRAVEYETRAYDAEIKFCLLNNVPDRYIIRLKDLKALAISDLKKR